MEQQPETLMEAVRYFAEEDRTLATMVALRWPEGVHCPTCGRTDVRFIATRKIWECKEKHPRRQFSAKVGTIFEDSPLKLDKWFVAIWSIANCKNGISSYELARATGVTQKSAWFMLHRIRLAMQTGTFIKMASETEAKETYIGGLAKNMHENVRNAKVHGHGIENFWSLPKRGIKGTYVSVEPFHRQRYVEEQTFRFNWRKDDGGGRFRKVVGSVAGKRLTYKALISRAASAA